MKLFADPKEFQNHVKQAMTARVTRGMDNAYSTLEFGSTFIQKISGRELFFTVGHEWLHKVLQGEYQYSLTGLDHAAIHEFLSDLYSMAFAKRIGWSYNQFAHTLRETDHFENVKNRGFMSIECHEAARAQIVILRQTLGDHVLADQDPHFGEHLLEIGLPPFPSKDPLKITFSRSWKRYWRAMLKDVSGQAGAQERSTTDLTMVPSAWSGKPAVPIVQANRIEEIMGGQQNSPSQPKAGSRYLWI